MTDIAPNRLYAQYVPKLKAVEWFNIVPSLGIEIRDVYRDIATSYDIDNSVGEQLNVIGRLVVLDRSFESQVTFQVNTQFGSTDTRSQFGGFDAQFQTTGTDISNDVSDIIFRMLIKAKIAKNNSNSTLDGVCEALRYITNINNVRVIDNEDMSFSVSFGDTLNDIEREVFNNFDVLPRPQGVRFLGYTEEVSITQFGGAFSFGDTRANFGLYFGA